MPDFETWRASNPLRPSSRAAWTRINDQPTLITLRRAGAVLPAQTVRIEYSTSARRDEDREIDVNALPAVGRLTLFGVRGHPTVADTDLRRGDRFLLGDTEVEVIAVLLLPGEVQALCETRT